MLVALQTPVDQTHPDLTRRNGMGSLTVSPCLGRPGRASLQERWLLMRRCVVARDG
jgi:hypothetical protein